MKIWTYTYVEDGLEEYRITSSPYQSFIVMTTDLIADLKDRLLEDEAGGELKYLRDTIDTLQEEGLQEVRLWDMWTVTIKSEELRG